MMKKGEVISMHNIKKIYRLNFFIKPFTAIEGTATDIKREYRLIEGIKNKSRPLRS